MPNWIQSWLAREDSLEKTDLLFVLAGLQRRKEYAAKLFQEGWSPQVLFSVARFELRRFPNLGLPQSPDLLAVAKSVPPPQRHYFVSLHEGRFDVQQIPVRQLGTLGEMDALADWLASHPGISSLLIVSSGPHLRRLRMCRRALLAPDLQVRFRAAPQEKAVQAKKGKESEGENAGEHRTIDSEESSTDLKSILLELVKVVCYALFLPLWRLGRLWRRPTVHSRE